VMIRHGVRVPDDMVLVGFDDIEFAAAAAIPLTAAGAGQIPASTRWQRAAHRRSAVCGSRPGVRAIE
jgi:hypothetical protein